MQKNLKTLEIYIRLKAPTIQDAAEESENARNSHCQIWQRLEISRGKLWVVLVLHLQLLLIHPMELGFKAFWLIHKAEEAAALLTEILWYYLCG